MPDKERIHYLGHACVSIQKGDYHLITDPWFGFNFHHETFYSFPPIERPSDFFLKSITAIHISHTHKDHCCAKSLSLFPKDIPIFILRHPSRRLFNIIQEMGFTNIIELVETKGMNHGPFRLFGFSQVFETPALDSSLLVRVFDTKFELGSNQDSRNYYFSNDCNLPADRLRLIKKFFPKIQGAFVGFNDIVPYPICYRNLSSSDSTTAPQQWIKNSQEQAQAVFKETLEVLKPLWAVPYADQIRLLNTDVFDCNQIFSNSANLPDVGDTQIFRDITGGDIISACGNRELKFPRSSSFILEEYRVSPSTFEKCSFQPPASENLDTESLKLPVQSVVILHPQEVVCYFTEYFKKKNDQSKIFKSTFDICIVRGSGKMRFRKACENFQIKYIETDERSPEVQFEMNIREKDFYKLVNNELDLFQLIYTYRIQFGVWQEVSERQFPHYIFG